MSNTVREVMCADPEIVLHSKTIREVAQIMRERSIGDVLVCDDDGRLCGIVTDRDLVVRGLAEERDPEGTPVGDVCSTRIVTVRADDSVDEAVRLMRDNAIRRVPVLDQDIPVGIVSIGDLARARDPASVLAEISAAPPNS
jgi:CBS domain-containing protein